VRASAPCIASRSATSSTSSGVPRRATSRGSGSAIVSHSNATSSSWRNGVVASGAISDRLQPCQVSDADSYILTSSRSQASTKAIVSPSRRSARASATSSVMWACTRAQPPACSSVSRRSAKHWPLAIARLGAGCQPRASPGPVR